MTLITQLQEIDVNKIRGNYVEVNEKGSPVAGGDDTIESIKMVAEKVNELIKALKDNN